MTLSNLNIKGVRNVQIVGRYLVLETWQNLSVYSLRDLINLTGHPINVLRTNLEMCDFECISVSKC